MWHHRNSPLASESSFWDEAFSPSCSSSPSVFPTVINNGTYVIRIAIELSRCLIHENPRLTLTCALSIFSRTSHIVPDPVVEPCAVRSPPGAAHFWSGRWEGGREGLGRRQKSIVSTQPPPFTERVAVLLIRGRASLASMLCSTWVVAFVEL